MSEKIIRISRYALSETDIVRTLVIASLTVSCMLITAIGFSRSFTLINYQLFFIPIVYTAYFYPRRGLLLAGLCGVAYQTVGYYYSYPDSVALTGVTSQAILFILVAIAIAYFIEKIRMGEARYRTVFEHSQLGIALFSRSDFRITQVNHKFCSMLHYSAEELVNKSFTELFVSPTERERFLEKIRKQPESEDFEARFMTQEGDGCWVNLSWSGIDNDIVSCTAVNINARKFAEKVNNDTMMKYRQLTENSPTGIVIVQDHSIRYTNPAFLKFSGYSAADLLGKDPLTLIAPEEQEEFSGFEKRWSASRPAGEKGEFHIRTKSGEIKVGVLFTTPIIHLGKPAILINLIDISVQERLEEQIHKENERRRGIIMTVAHELRTPLQPILGYLNLLIQDPQGFGIVDETKKILERCLVSVDRERQIINQMLDLSVLESGKLLLSYTTFSLPALIQSVLDTNGYVSKADVTVDIPHELMITADRDRLYSVLDSLLSNAVNFSKPPRKIVISYCSGNNDRTYCISVKDNGTGIPESAFESIFEPFQLADASKLSRKYGRIGLSLSIAKKIVRMHNGDITVTSTVNEGSTFTIHLPKEVPHA